MRKREEKRKFKGKATLRLTQTQAHYIHSLPLLHLTKLNPRSEFSRSIHHPLVSRRAVDLCSCKSDISSEDMLC